jgi:2,3-bisphosphoglycerate-independent phosphoglycerate mutase
MLNTLIVMDGFGLSDIQKGNAVLKNAPYIDYLMNNYPNCAISASGLDVGLPCGQMGNSEVGHTNIGAGRVVYQELTRISKEIADGEFFENEELLKAVNYVKKSGGALHAFGLVSDGGVHSHIEHIFALIKLAKQQGLSDIYLHCFMDGRDTSPTSGKDFLGRLWHYTKSENFGTIASVLGRFYAMDRDNRWDRVAKAYNCLVCGEGEKNACGYEYLQQSYEKGTTDEFILPAVMLNQKGESAKRIASGDAVVFFNFRPDRAREITRAFTDKNFNEFERKTGFVNPYFVGFTKYDQKFENVAVAFKAQSLKNNFGEIISAKGLKQLRIAETEKYAHVTFFFNSGAENPVTGEDRVLIPSPKVATYDLQPQMSAYEVANEAKRLIETNKYDVIILNFANCDMVGHTGDFDAAVKAVKAVDECVKIVTEACKAAGGNIIITSDHGNAEKMLCEAGGVFTAHTTNDVPFILLKNSANGYLKKGELKLKQNGRLCDIAPTMLDIMNINKPVEMTGSSLINN